ncbi:hypothetical protein CANARDRAFT_199581 [[Candida] arabinofermentans NRRL YB-2248]|uniref:RGS domain-containing protein n=1 Tax=[Candida] arabinofermentans NRRL YB-2248 TaxID=983967 RepID=A0A1E4T045_9ASCO|nr:hypothetical protein CANARDRAFT_199581 [[Candida] arabinofermentans NRRL YB-2248]
MAPGLQQQQHHHDQQGEKVPQFPVPKNNQHLEGPLDRWPVLFEILNRKTQKPVDLWSFYVFMRGSQKSMDYLDFWIATVKHMNLCKAYVKGLKQSLLVNERIRNAEKVTEHVAKSRPDSKLSLMEGPPYASFINDSSQNLSHFDSTNSSRDSKSSSMLLELLMKNNLLEEHDSHRMSVFLRGEGSIRSSDPLVNTKIDELKRKSMILHDVVIPYQQQHPSTKYNEPIRPFIAGEDNQNNSDDEKRISTIDPEMVETLIQNDYKESDKPFASTHFITRANLRASSQMLLQTFFSDESEKKILIPQDMISRVVRALEVEGRDDPEVFGESREYVFKAMEHEAYPNFLRYYAMCNVTSRSAIYRIMGAFFCGFAAFWTGYSMIFMNYDPKKTRAVVTLPFFLASYFLFSSYYRIDPILCFLGYGESKAYPGGIVPIEEPFVKKLLLKRSLFVLLIICLVAAAFSVLFALVPGYALHH